MPKTEDDLPIGKPIPVDGKVHYDEGIHIGYRAWLKTGTEPAYAFGLGLGYTTWSFDGAVVPDEVVAGSSFTATVGITNTGDRRGKQVVQAYAERADSEFDRPVRWLIGFADLTLEAGESRDVDIVVPARELACYDDGWQYEPGVFEIYAGFSVTDTPGRGRVRLA